MKKVLVFGTFDGLHEGHRFLFREAKRYGERLFVVVARDATVRRVKKHDPVFSEEERLRVVSAETLVDGARLGYLDDVYRVVEEIRPDVICLGYDQHTFADRLPEVLQQRGITASIERLDAYKPEMYKSSLLHQKGFFKKNSP